MIRKQVFFIWGPFTDGKYMIMISQFDALPGECFPHKTEKRLLYEEGTAEEIGQILGGN